MNIRTVLPAALFAAAVSTTVLAQQAPAPAAAPAAPPPWKQGMTPEQEKSTLHPFAIEVTGKAAKDLPIDKLKVPTGFKVEVWADRLFRRIEKKRLQFVQESHPFQSPVWLPPPCGEGWGGGFCVWSVGIISCGEFVGNKTHLETASTLAPPP